MSDNIISPSNQSDPPSPAAKPRANAVMRWIGILFIGFALLSLYYGAIVLFGWRSGESIRFAQAEEQRIASITRQKELAIEDINQNNYELAIRRLDYVMGLSPNDTEAAGLRNEAIERQSVLLTPSPTPTLTPSPTPTVTPTPSPLPPTPDPTKAFEAVDEAYRALQTQLRNNPTQYAENIQQLEAFRSQYSNYNRRELDQQLYDLYIEYGRILTRTDEIERGLGLLNRARDLGDLPDDVEGDIFWAEQYLQGIVYYEINWDAYLSYFRPLCANAPLFQDSCTKLQEGLIYSANIAISESDWCLAETLYNEAAQANDFVTGLQMDIELVSEQCDLATPTPGTSLTPETGADEFLIGTPTPEDASGRTGLPTEQD